MSFLEVNTLLGSAGLVSGTTTSSQAVGTHTIQATYQGDTNFTPVEGKEIVARFDGGRLVLREIEQRLKVADRLAACIDDLRDPDSTVHTVADIICFRLLMIAAGYEDGNDATSLRTDPLFKLALDRLGRDLRHLSPDMASA